MDNSKKFYKVSGSSLLESVIALCVISICFYFTILIFATVFNPKTSTSFYKNQLQSHQLFYEAELEIPDSEESAFQKEEIEVSSNLKQITIKTFDSIQPVIEEKFYVQTQQ